LAETDDPLAKNLGTEPIINENGGAPLENEQVGLEENEDHPLMIMRRNLNKKMMMNLSTRGDHSIKEEVSFLITMLCT
jgi:hypothetical protein